MTERGFIMKFISGEAISVVTEKYIKTYYKKLNDDKKNMLNEYVEAFTGFSSYPEFIEYLFYSSECHYPDLYNCDEEFLHNKYLREVIVNGKTYMMFACWVTFGDFCPHMPNLYFLEDIPCFAYYEFVDQTNANGTVGANMKADKIYSCEIDKDDYPEWVNIMKTSDILKLIPKKILSLYEGNIEEC